MDDYTKVLVYGSFDGFAYSTDDSIAISVVLDSGEKVEIPEEFIVSADQMVNKYKIKLKDVIARIEKFDLATKAVWINEILNELGSEYGAFKYKAGYEQGKFDGAMEHEKVTIPQFVADWIEKAKKSNKNVVEFFGYKFPNIELIKYFSDRKNIDLVTRAYLDGYEVEKEPKYTVKFKATKQYLSNDELGTHFDPSFRSNFTKSDLEKLGLGWVFDCEGMEVEKVGK